MASINRLIIDDFYPDPMVVRCFALSLQYSEGETDRDRKYYRGAQSTPWHPYSQIGMDIISTILRRAAFWDAPHGDFRQLTSNSSDSDVPQRWIHYDSVHHQYAAIVYLNLPDDCQGGTEFFRHKEFGWDRFPPPTSPEAQEVMTKYGLDWDQVIAKLAEDGFDSSRWEQLSTVEMRFNRCIIFDGSHFHARASEFGTTKEAARLTQNYFFNLEGTEFN